MMLEKGSCKGHEITNLPEMVGPPAELDIMAGLGDVEGGWIGMLLARILDRIWPMQVSANASKRLRLSNFSVYTMTSRTASESFLLASVDSEASVSRSDCASVRILLAIATCSVWLAGEPVSPGGCLHVNGNS